MCSTLYILIILMAKKRNLICFVAQKAINRSDSNKNTRHIEQYCALKFPLSNGTHFRARGKYGNGCCWKWKVESGTGNYGNEITTYYIQVYVPKIDIIISFFLWANETRNACVNVLHKIVQWPIIIENILRLSSCCFCCFCCIQTSANSKLMQT